jgi:hypothetical protein
MMNWEGEMAKILHFSEIDQEIYRDRMYLEDEADMKALRAHREAKVTLKMDAWDWSSDIALVILVMGAVYAFWRVVVR